MDSSMSAQASSCPSCKHPTAACWNSDTCALKLQAARAKEGAPVAPGWEYLLKK